MSGRSPWLSPILSWTLQLQELADDDSAQREVVATMRRLEMVYLQAEEGSQRAHKVDLNTTFDAKLCSVMSPASAYCLLSAEPRD